MRKRFALSKAEMPEILTYGSLERWSIIITIFDIFLEKIKNGQEPPVIVRPREIDDYGYNANSIRNTILLLINAGILKPHEKDFPLDVKLTQNCIKIMNNELVTWNNIKETMTVDKLRLSGLEILGDILQEIDVLFKRSVVK